MVSEKQIEANRCNALKSTGPRTPEGKAAVSLNPLKHGLRARRTVLPGENEEEFHQLCADLEAGWHPQTRTEQLLLEDMAVSQWRLQRFEAYENQILGKGVLNKEKMALLAQLFQQQSRLKNSFLKSMREIERLQKNRTIPPDQPTPAVAEPAAHIAELRAPFPTAAFLADQSSGTGFPACPASPSIPLGAS